MRDREKECSFDRKTGAGGSIREQLEAVSNACIKCDLCLKECAFLRKYGRPKEIADRYDPARKDDERAAFECSLCRLCRAVCPAAVDPAGLFLQMRREAVRRGNADYPQHAALKGYERRGTSRAYSYYGLPEGCDTVFFPGCALSGTRSEKVILAYQKLKESFPSLGIVLDCCTKPSHDLGREDYFTAMFGEMIDYLAGCGVKRVIVACPNCYRMFSTYGRDLSTKTVYEILVQDVVDGNRQTGIVATIHDSCVVRFHEGIHESVRRLLQNKGYSIEEMPHFGNLTLCCGEGGAVRPFAPDFAAIWGRLRQREAAGRRVVTYCASCANTLARFVPSVHVLDILWEGEAGVGRKKRAAKPPLTYWKRLRLKRWFKKNVPVGISRERTFTGEEAGKKGARGKFLVFLLFLAAVIVVVKAAGVSGRLEQHALRTWIESFGAIAPIVYVLTFAVAPALLLPGLPITIAGGFSSVPYGAWSME